MRYEGFKSMGDERCDVVAHDVVAEDPGPLRAFLAEDGGNVLAQVAARGGHGNSMVGLTEG